jgi:hypothetical protein
MPAIKRALPFIQQRLKNWGSIVAGVVDVPAQFAKWP